MITNDLLVFSHLKWNFVFQRPYHLLTRHSKHRRVYYFEAPSFTDTKFPKLDIHQVANNLFILSPQLPQTCNAIEVIAFQKDLVDQIIFQDDLKNYTLWYYNPLAIDFTEHLSPTVTIYDCIDGYQLDREEELLNRTDIVFTDSQSLYDSKSHLHHNIHCMPNSFDFNHFVKARTIYGDPKDQEKIPYPRIGFFGVIDEHFDVELLTKLADSRPSYEFIIVGPVLIDPKILPRKTNIHYLGKKEYEELPAYLSGWDCTFMPFTIKDSTRFFNPTSTPEFLASGNPVVSTPLYDVIHPYADEGLALIGNSAEDFANKLDRALVLPETNKTWLQKVDTFLKGNTWNDIFIKMSLLEEEVRNKKIIYQSSHIMLEEELLAKVQLFE